MGRVFLGFSPAGRPVAVKVVYRELARDRAFINRFRQEVAAARRVSGAYTAAVVDAGDGDPPWLATTLVMGPSLDDAVDQQGLLPEVSVWRLAAGLAEALAEVHSCGLVHRDLKPSNVLLAVDGPRVIDFGISRALDGTAMTGTGIVVGTLGFMSPEQATGSPLTGSSDIYSLGVVAYECLSGDPPFMADQPLAIAIMHKHDPVPQLPPDVPRPVADLVYAMLAKAPDGRPETAQHVADRADVIREARSRSGHNSGPITANLPVVPNFPPPDGNDFYNNGNDFYNGEAAFPPDPRPRRRALMFAGAGLAACGIIAIIVLLLTSSTTPAATMTGKTGHPGSPGQSASEAATPTTASLPASPVSGNATGTNLGTASETSGATRSAGPTTSARQSSTAKSSPTTSTSSSASATTSSAPATGTTSSSPPPTSPPTSPTDSESPILPLAGDGTGG